MKKIKVTKLFDCRHPLWQNNKPYNEKVVNLKLEYCHDLLRLRGYLFLNEVYRELGIAATREGQVAGWVFDKDHEKDIMWTVWTKDDEYDDVYITFEAHSDILHALPDEEDEL